MSSKSNKKVNILKTDKEQRKLSTIIINKYIDNSELSEQVEDEIFKFCKKYASYRGINPKLSNYNFLRIYKTKIYSIVANLNQNSLYVNNKKLLNKIKTEVISATDLVNMKPIDLHPKRWRQFIKKQELLDKEVVDLSLQATTDQFKCPKCKSKKCTYVSVQIRSADEGMTNFITCVECSNSWRQG
tara:strand:- start:226 stop:783 length:558 start_codon:yes stop_codon:yes gene_type:complete